MLITIGLAVCALGSLLATVASILFIVAGFTVSVGWGLAVLFLPGSGLIFLFAHWEDAKKAFKIHLLGILLIFTGAVLCYRGMQMGEANAFLATWIRQIVPEGTELPIQMPEPEINRSTPPVAAETTPEDADYLVGQTLEEVKERFGFPKARLSTGGMTIYQYEHMEFEADTNGVVIRQVELVQ